MPRKVLDVRKECVRLSCQRQTKSPSGLSVGGLFAYRHAPERLTSRTPWNKSSAYVSDTHYKSEIFKSVILSVLYHIRHFSVFVIKRKPCPKADLSVRLPSRSIAFGVFRKRNDFYIVVEKLLCVIVRKRISIIHRFLIGQTEMPNGNINNNI